MLEADIHHFRRVSQLKYREDGEKEMKVNLYSLLPETLDTQHAKEASELQSQVAAQCWLKNHHSASQYGVVVIS